MYSLAARIVKESLLINVVRISATRSSATHILTVGQQRRYLGQQQRQQHVTTIPLKGEGFGGHENQKITPLGWILLLIPATTFGLGCWQVKRKAWKEQLIKDMEKLTKMAPVELPDDLTDLNKMEYRLVTVRGKFLHDKELIMGPRSFIRSDAGESAGGLFSQRNESNGYLIITPFQLADRNDIILINRGWVSRKQVRPHQRPEGQYDKEIELSGIVRSGEQRPQFTPEQKGEIFLYRDLPKMCALTGASPVLLDATYESSIPGGPIGGQTRVTLRNEHLSYLITWFSLSAATSYMWYRMIVKGLPPI